VAVRALRNRGLEEFGKLQLKLLKQMDEGTIGRHDAQAEVEKYWMGALRRAVMEGDVTMGSLMSGQSVGLVTSVKSVRTIMDELVSDTAAELVRLQHYLQ